MLAAEYRQDEQSIYLQIAESLGFLPIALRQAIALMLFGPHLPAAELRDKLAKEDRLELLCRGAAIEGSDHRVIETVFDLSSSLLTGELLDALQYLAICAPGPAPLDFLKRLAGRQHIAEELERLFPDDRWALRAVYCNRAVILKDWGRLDEAMALLKKNEKIKKELGDRAGLSACWWNQGIIYGDKGDRAKQIALWQKSIAANKAMGVPTEKDEEEVKRIRG